jgi:hypothetical protein
MTYKILLLNFFTAVIIVWSCNKNNLNQPALGLLDDATIASKSGVVGLLIGAYAFLDGVSADDQGSVGGFYSGASNWIYGSVCGSEAYTGSRATDQPPIIEIETFHATGATIGPLDDKWKALYAGIARANAVLRVMRQVKDMTPTDTIEIRAEAVFLRAWYHFEAIKIWNKVPFVDENITYDAGNYYLNNDSLIWPAIEHDLMYSMNNLPSTQSAVGRANKWAAKAYLAKAYMFEHRYADAKPLLEDLIGNGVTSGGLPYALGNFADNFNAEFKNKSEAVFSVQMSVNDGAQGSNGNIGDILNYPFGGGPNGWGFFQPSQWLVNHFKTDPVTGLPDFDHFNDLNVGNDEGIGSNDHFTPDAGTLDPRLDWTVGRRGVPYLDWGPHPGKIWVRDQPFGGPYAPVKNVFYQSQVGHFSDLSFWASGATANNVNLIRYSDILLWAAEAEVEVGGDLNKAREYVNSVRARAANPLSWVKNEDNIPFAKKVTNSPGEFAAIDDTSFKDIQQLDWVVRKDLNQTWTLLVINPDGTKVWNAYSVPQYKIGLYENPWTDKEFARKAIRYERVLELAMEGHRFFDLVRWGIADQEINLYLQKEQQSRSYLSGAVFIKGKNEYFPIPQSQIDLSVDAHGVQHLHQNPGY